VTGEHALIRRTVDMSGLGVSGILFAMLAASWAPAAQAYLDPGTGSLVVQILIGAFAAAGTAVSLYWHRFKKLLTRTRNSGKAPAASRDGDENGEAGSV
jgi:hypothetical protein